ncbi:hypothetical protein ACFL5K_03440 [Gemmatimonadota bacterium]
MDTEIYNLLILIGVVSVIFFVGVTILRIRKKRDIDQKFDEYSRLLDQAANTRRSYISIMEKTKPLLKEVNSIKAELSKGKSKLSRHRIELRAQILLIRKEIEKGGKSKTDKRVIDQMKIRFDQHWKVFNSLKRIYREILGRYCSLEEEYQLLTEEEELAHQQWTQEKNAVLNSFKVLSTLTTIRHPFELLGKE